MWVQPPWDSRALSLRLQPPEVLHDMLKAARGLHSSIALDLWPAGSPVVLLLCYFH